MAQVRVRLQTKRVQLLFEGDESVFERQIEPLLLRLAGEHAKARATAPSGAPVSAPAPVPAPAREAAAEPAKAVWQPAGTSFRTFQRQLADSPNGTANQIAAYAFYLWNYERRETFSVEEIEGCFEAGGETVPDDLAAACVDLEDSRILQPAAHEGTWRLTPKGTNQVRKLLR